MPRASTVEELFQELDQKVKATLGRIEHLQMANDQLQERIRALERRQAEAAARIDRMLDRLDSLG